MARSRKTSGSSRKTKSTRRKTSTRRSGGKFIQGAIKKPGALRKTAKVKKGQKIPLKTLNKLKKSKNPTTRRRANLAITLRKLSKRKKRKS